MSCRHWRALLRLPILLLPVVPVRGQQRDSAGIRIIASAAPELAGAAAWRLASRPAFDLGGNGDVISTSTVIELAGGRLVVQGGENQLRFLDRNGKVVARFGRKGEGPGEFRQMILLAGGGDSVVVHDESNGRLTRVTANGKLVRMTPFRLRRTSTPGMIDGQFMEPFGFFGDGSVALKAWDMISQGPPGARYRDSLLVLRVPPGGDAGTSLVRTGGREMIQHAYNPRNGSRVAFGQHAEVAMGDDAVFVARNARWEIEEYGRDGRLRRLLRTSIPLRPVTSVFIANQKLGPLPDVWARWGAERRELYTRETHDITYAGYFAPVTALFTAPDGWLYVLGSDEPEMPRTLSAFDRDGALLTRIVVPDGLRVVAVGRDRVYAAREDDEGDIHLLAFDIIRP